MTKVSKPYTRGFADPNESRVVSIRVHPDTLKSLRILAAEHDMTVCALLRAVAEKIAANGTAH